MFTSRKIRRTARLTPAFIIAAVAFAGCGSGGGSTKAGEPATLKVGTIPIADVAPLYLGIQQGFFKQQKLTIKPQVAQGGAAIVTSVLSGDDQIGFSNTTSLIVARSKNLPVKIIAQGVLGAPTRAKAWDALLVKPGSDIKSASDLAGKTVAVNNLKNVGPLTINTALAKEGADYKGVKYVEIDFPDMPQALKSGKVDAAWMVEPFVSQSKADGSRTIVNPYEQTAPSLTVATYFVSEQYAAKNKDVVRRFRVAMKKSLTYASAHPAAVRKIVTTYTKIPPAAAAHMTLPQWRSDLNTPTIAKTAALAKRYGFVSKTPSTSDLILAP